MARFTYSGGPVPLNTNITTNDKGSAVIRLDNGVYGLDVAFFSTNGMLKRIKIGEDNNLNLPTCDKGYLLTPSDLL